MSEPNSHLLRLGAIERWSGLPHRTVCEIAAEGRLGGARLWPGGRRYFLREVVRHVLFAAPRPLRPFGPEPEPELLRLAQVLAWTGLSRAQFCYAAEHGIAGGRTLRPGGRNFYARDVIRAQFFTPLLPASWPEAARKAPNYALN